jgi:hypothetical protein
VRRLAKVIDRADSVTVTDNSLSDVLYVAGSFVEAHGDDQFVGATLSRGIGPDPDDATWRFIAIRG